MRFVLQRVLNATVSLPTLGQHRTIGPGILVYMGVSKDDISESHTKIHRFCEKIATIKIFSDETGKICRSLKDTNGAVMLISNFTLYGANKKGTQIDFSDAAAYHDAQTIYEQLVQRLQADGLTVITGEFGEKMLIESVVDGPVNIVINL